MPHRQRAAQMESEVEEAPAKAKPTPQQIGVALHAALKGMVAEAEASGQRDQPHVQAAKAALEMAEPEKPEEKA